MIFRPKIDSLYIVPIILIFVIVIILGYIESNLFLIFTFSFIFLFTFFYIRKTFYEISGSELIIHNLLSSSKVDISQITEVCENKSFLAVDSAFSYRKLFLKYGNYGKLYISPIDELGFIQELSKINSKIKINI